MSVIFESFWNFFGFVILVAVFFEGIEGVVKAWRNKGDKE